MAITTTSSPAHLATAQILQGWLRDINYDIRQNLRPFPTELYIQLRDWVLSKNLEESQLTPILKLLPSCTSAADEWCPRASMEVKRYTALFTTFLLYVDDRAEKDLEKVLPDLKIIASESKTGLQSITCQDAAIGLWLDLIVSETGKLYGPYATGAITKSLMDFILGNTVEANFAQSLKLPTEFASRSSQFIRDKTGAGEAFAHLLFPEQLIEERDCLKTYIQVVRQMVDFIDHVNDILSFYKEFVVGMDEGAHIMNLARVAGRDPQDILKEVCSEMTETIRITKDLLKDVPQVGEIWDEFVNGYIVWHIHQERYRLKELGLGVQ